MTTPAAGLAFLAGVVSFFSPCVISLVPGYLAAAAGGGRSRDVLGRTALFIAGFTVVFAALGAGASLFGQALLAQRALLARIGGAAMIVMGLSLAGWLTVPFLQREMRFHPGAAAGPGPTFLLGMAVGFGWTPCVGPILASILMLAGAAETAARGAALLVMYAMGLAVPFAISGIVLSRGAARFSHLGRASARLQTAAAVVMIAMGVLLVSGRWYYLNVAAQRLFSRLGIALWSSF